ncbi:hypothetical protein CRG98_033467 [Punica granatum]|uniref:Pentatricopeptide repeat-containing protein At5g57250, mitochondrial n=1 Tax=Punica granatum TaxID=22663 RepID=A0A2I0IQ55_PUNGR|nr:hypothetical protein CRG98_033467 [Punica granatum]
MHNYPTAKLSINPLLRTQLPRPLSSSSSSSLHGYISNSSCLQTLLKRGFHPTVEHLNRHLLFLSESHRFNSVIHFFPQLESNNIKPNSYSHSFLARALLNLRRFDEAEHLMRKAPNFARSSMWDSLIQGYCVHQRDPEKGFSVLLDCFGKDGILPSSYTFCSLIHSFSSLGMMGRAIEVLELMSDEKVKEGDLVEAFRKHKLMSDKRITGDVISYTTLIDGFSKEWSVEKAGGVLAKMRKEGLKPNLITYTAVILGFCRKGKLEEAVTLFRRIEDMGIVLDEFLYATLIYGACKKGDYDFVFDLLDEMEKKGISPGVITYNIVINGLCKVGRTSKADEFSKGMLGDIVTYTTLLNGYIGEESIEGVLETKKRFEETGLRIDTVMCNILMKASFLVGIFEEAYALYKRMEDIGLTPNAFTYCILIDGFCKAGRIDQALEIFDDFRKSSIPSVACYNCIIHGLCKNSMIGIAIDVLIELIQEDLPIDLKVPVMLIKAAFREESAEGVLDFVSRIEKLQPHIYSFVCNEAICLLCKRGFPDLARDVYVMMRWRSLAVTSKSYYLILKKLIHHKDRQAYVHPLLGMFVRDHGIVDPGVGKIVVLYSCMTDTNMGLQFLDKMKKENLVLTLPFAVFEKLVDDGRALDAYKLVIDAKDDYLSNMDVVDYTIIIGGLCKGGYINEALDLCSFARKKGTALNIISYNMIIKGLCRHGRLIEAFRLYDSLERIGLVPSEITYATLIDVLCKERLMLEADKLFQAMVLRGNEPGIHVYNSFIDGYCKIGQLEDALKTLEKVELKGLELDGFTVSALINGYCLKGDMEGALGFFCEFKNRCVLPDFLGFLNLVRGLSTKGRIDEARSVLREMLRSQSVAGLISKVEDSDIGDDSVYNFLVGLCEQGSVKEAIIVLNEIASMYFPASRFQGDEYQLREHNESHEEEIGTAEETEDMMNNETREFKFPHDFDCFYSQVAKLCSTGETQMANSILKNGFLSSGGLAVSFLASRLLCMSTIISWQCDACFNLLKHKMMWRSSSFEHESRNTATLANSYSSQPGIFWLSSTLWKQRYNV